LGRQLSETINLEWLGANVRQLQADLLCVRMEISMIAKRLEIMTDRIANFEARMETRFDKIEMLSGRWERH
jgi:hypothetical protein